MMHRLLQNPWKRSWKSNTKEKREWSVRVDVYGETSGEDIIGRRNGRLLTLTTWVARTQARSKRIKLDFVITYLVKCTYESEVTHYAR